LTNGGAKEQGFEKGRTPAGVRGPKSTIFASALACSIPWLTFCDLSRCR